MRGTTHSTPRPGLRLLRRLCRYAAIAFELLLLALFIVWTSSCFLHFEYRFGRNSIEVWAGRIEAEWGTLAIAPERAAEELGWHVRARQPDLRFRDRIGLRWPEAHLHRHVSRPWGDLLLPLWAPTGAAMLAVIVLWLGRNARAWRDVAMALGIGLAGGTMGVWLASAFMHVRFETGSGPLDVALLDGTLEVTSGSADANFSSAASPHCTWTRHGYHLVAERRDSMVPISWGRRIGIRVPESMSGPQIVRVGGSSPGGFAIPLWCAAIPATAFAAMMIRFSRRYIAPGHCRKCGYDLTLNRSGVCPECGRPVERRIQAESTPTEVAATFSSAPDPTAPLAKSPRP